MLQSHGQCGSAGSGMPYQCSGRCPQPSQTVLSGGSELLSWTAKWLPTLTILPFSFFPKFAGVFQRLG